MMRMTWMKLKHTTAFQVLITTHGSHTVKSVDAQKHQSAAFLCRLWLSTLRRSNIFFLTCSFLFTLPDPPSLMTTTFTNIHVQSCSIKGLTVLLEVFFSIRTVQRELLSWCCLLTISSKHMILLIWQRFADEFLSLPAPSEIALSYETGQEILYVSICISLFSCHCPFFTSPKGSEALFSPISYLPQREVKKTVMFSNIHIEAKRDDKAF